MRYIDLVNFAIEESGLELDLLDEETWDSPVSGRRVYPRLKRYVNQSWKNIQLSRNQWEFKTAKVSDLVYPRFRYTKGSGGTSPVGKVFRGVDSGTEILVSRLVVEDGDWDIGSDGQVEFELVRAGRPIQPGEVFVSSNLSVAEDPLYTTWIDSSSTQDRVVEFPITTSSPFKAGFNTYIPAGTRVRFEIDFQGEQVIPQYPIAILNTDAGSYYINVDMVVGNNKLVAEFETPGDIHPGYGRTLMVNASDYTASTINSVSFDMVEPMFPQWETVKVSDNWLVSYSPGSANVTVTLEDGLLVIEGSGVSSLNNVRLEYDGPGRTDSLRISDLMSSGSMSIDMIGRVNTLGGDFETIDFSPSVASSDYWLPNGVRSFPTPIVLNTPLSLAEGGPQPSWDAILISTYNTGGSGPDRMSMRLEVGTVNGAEELQSFTFEQKGSYNFGLDRPSLFEIDWTSFTVSGPNTASMPVSFVPYSNWLHESHSYAGGTLSPPSFVSQDYAGNVVFLQHTLKPFRVSFIYTIQPQVLEFWDDVPTRLPEAYHEWIAWEAVKRIATYDKNPQLYAHAERNAQFYRNRAESNLMPHMAWGGSRFSE